MPFINITSIPPRETFPGFEGRFFHGAGMTIAHWNIKAGAAAPVHSHVHEQMVDVISGELELTINGEPRVLKAGMGAVVPSNVPHGAKAITDCFVIDVFSPVREDYK
jgi:quercetin dioxygenase-like cupin family protein